MNEEKKAYIGTKIIKAVGMSECTFLENIKGEVVPIMEDRPGYMVEYPDGYKSWSPNETFEAAYREVSQSEIELIDSTIPCESESA